MQVARIIACAALAWAGGLVLTSAPAHAGPPVRGTVSCDYPSAPNLHLSFEAPAKLGDLPEVDFDYPVKVTRFSFRDGNLSMVAMDEADRGRVRIVISAKLNKAKGTYDGQATFDFGGNQLMMDNGRISCSVSR
jgi:hypothetical protein